MNFGAGTRFGPYEIVAPLGAGGMGEVYRARDGRLAREVALKTVPRGVGQSPERLARFEQEARAAARLNHPNILAVHDIGNHDGVPFVVSELLEGETVGDRLRRGPIGQRKAIEYAIQIANGLAAAHDKGIVHRDLKPDNLFITREDRVKILDFGLAKLSEASPSSADAQAATVLDRTEPGAVLGTAAYMSPEQVRSQPVDHRADLFSLGVILYEMLSGVHPFRRDSAVETMTAILRDDPPELLTSSRQVAPALERMVRHLLEKKPEHRFQSARDLVFNLESLSALGQPTSSGLFIKVDERRRRPVWPIVALLLAGAAVLGGLALVAGRAPQVVAPTFHRLTFRHGRVYTARFSADGHTVVYSAAWEGAPLELYSMRPESPESSPLPFSQADLLSVSPTGEMAIALRLKLLPGWSHRGTLARAPLVGGGAREVQDDVEAADWTPDGRLAAVRTVEGRSRLEFPLGHVVYDTPGWISHPRVSPDGKRVAFLDHPDAGDDHGLVAVIDPDGKKRNLTVDWPTAEGLAWSPSGGEIWYAAAEKGAARALRAVSLDGRQRLVLRVPGEITLQDVSREGRVLLTRENWWRRIVARGRGQASERDLSWLDWSYPTALSADGKSLLFYEQGEGGGASHGVYLRPMDGAAAIKLGDGRPHALSPDGKWVLTVPFESRDRLMVLPTGAGASRALEGAQAVSGAAFLPDGKRVLYVAQGRTWMRSIDGGPAQPVTDEGSTGTLVSPDGKWLVVADREGHVWLHALSGGRDQPVQNLTDKDTVLGWSGDGQTLFVTQVGQVPAHVERLDLATGGRAPWRDLAPQDAAGVTYVSPILVAPDGNAYAYGYRRILADLYLVEGLR